MAKKLLESAFIEVLDIDSEEFQQRKYFFVRQAIYIEKQIRTARNNSQVRLIEFESSKAIIPEDVISIKAVFPNNPFGLLPEEQRDYKLVKSIADGYKSLRFVEQEDLLLISHEIVSATIVVEILERDEFNRYIVEESHLPAITSYLKFKVFEKEKAIAALKGAYNFYMLRSQVAEEEQNYSRFIINARAEERFKETEEVIEPNEIVTEDDYLNNTI